MKQAFDLNDYIEDIELNGLRGRMISAPASNPKAKDLNVLFIHGHHSSLERMTGIVELMRDFGNFCLPDLPGFGGMDHFYSLGLKPTTENYADYIAAFIKLHYGTRKKFVIVGYSLGFLYVTRMLQKYPEIRKQIIEVISVAGLVHGDNFAFSSARKRFYRIVTYILRTRIISWIMREIFLRKWFLGTIYTKSHNAKSKFSGMTKEKVKEMVNFEVVLWRINHIPTWCFTAQEMFRADLTKYSPTMPLKLLAVTVDMDQYFDNASTEQHMRILYQDVKVLQSHVEKHGVSVVASAEDAKAFFPKALMSHLRSLR